MNYDKQLTKLATAYNNADYAKVNSVALGLVEHFKDVNSNMQAQIKQLQYENATLRLTVEHSVSKIAQQLAVREELEFQINILEDSL
tara:strand:+ start:668 stop:928 length:261 start_codon:yes stop_codon:yes gene_type:complete